MTNSAPAKQLDTSGCKGFSRASSSLEMRQKNNGKAISLLESKHADLEAAGRGCYVHAMAMTKMTRETDLAFWPSSIIHRSETNMNEV